MKDNLNIFDLKNTLVNSEGLLMINQEDIYRLKNTSDLVLYSIAEPWTFNVLREFSELFANFSAILLVDKKKPDDLRGFRKRYKKIVVIGDGEEAEIAVARTLGFEAILVDGSAGSIVEALEALKG